MRIVRRTAPFPLLLMMLPALHAAGVTVMFDPANPLTGPYPSDALTVADQAQKTGRRINLPRPDCAADTLGCIVLPSLNQLDGFNPQPRIRITFSPCHSPLEPGWEQSKSRRCPRLPTWRAIIFCVSICL